MLTDSTPAAYAWRSPLVVPDPFYMAMMTGTDLLELADLLERPAWQDDALCREHPEVDFFPGRGEPTWPAQRVCARCLVRSECTQYALDAGSHLAGVWGGTTGRQRRQAIGRGWSADQLLAAQVAYDRGLEDDDAKTLADELRLTNVCGNPACARTVTTRRLESGRVSGVYVCHRCYEHERVRGAVWPIGRKLSRGPGKKKAPASHLG